MQIATPMKVPCVYILASKRNGTLYTGVTSDLANRVSLHKQGLIEGFTKRYKVHMLVYYETHHLMPDAIRREKQIKEWKRLWKIRLIESMNPEWFDLFDERTGEVFDGPADVSRVTGRTSDALRCMGAGLFPASALTGTRGAGMTPPFGGAPP